jgi:hypothetical protein
MSQATSIPEILKTKTQVAISNMDIESEVLEPISKTQDRVLFVLPKKGILDSTTRMNIQVLAPSANDGFFPINTGIFSTIKTATLRIGTKVIQEIEDVAHYITHSRMVRTNEQRKQVDMVLNGILDVVGQDHGNYGRLCVEDAIYDEDGINAVVPAKIRPTNSTTTSPTLSVALDDLFGPMLTGLQLPLYLIQAPVSIEIVFNRQNNVNADVGKVLCFDSGYSGSKAVSINLDSVKLLCDFLMYNDDTMRQTQNLVNSQNGMVLPFDDIALTTSNIQASTQPGTGILPSRFSVVRDIGSAGKKVKDILIISKKEGADNLLGVYKSDAHIHPERYNLRVNDRMIYPRDVSQVPRMADEVQKVLNGQLYVHNAMYSNMLNSDLLLSVDGNNVQIMTNTLEGHSQGSLVGSRHVTGIDLRNMPGGSGIDVGIKNIRYEASIQHSRNDYEARELKFFVKYQRLLQLKDGLVEISA